MARINSNGKNCRRNKVENHHPWESGYLLFAKINYSFPLRIGSNLVPHDWLDTGVLPTVDIKQIETFVPTDSSCSYCHYQPVRFHSVEAEIPLVNNTSWSAEGIVISIHVTLGILPTCMYGGFTADVYENGGMKSSHKSHLILINSFISL